jgi:hypothetical protein
MTEVGRKLEVGVSVEAVRGTAETTVQKWLRRVTASILPRTSKVVDDTTRGRLEDSEGARIVRKWFDGDLEGIVHADTLGYLLSSIYGLPTTSTVAGSVKSHAFALDNTIEHPTLSIFRKDSDIEQKVYGGGAVNTLEINASTDDFVRFKANIICANEDDDANNPSYVTDYDFIGKDITVKVADTEAGLAAATALKLKTLAIKWDAGVISDFVLGSENPDANYNSKLGIEIDFTKNYEDTTFEDLFKSDTYKYMQITIEGDADLGSGNHPKLVLVLNRCQVQDFDRTSDAGALVEESIKVKAFYNATDSEQSTATLVNKTATYTPGS